MMTRQSSSTAHWQSLLDDWPQRLQLFGLDQAAIRALADSRELIAPQVAAITDELMAGMLQIPQAAQILGRLPDPQRLHAALGRYVLQLFSAGAEPAHAACCLNIGQIHRQHNVEPRFFLAGLQQLQHLLRQQLRQHSAPEQLAERLAALERRLLVDGSLVIDVYMHAAMQELRDSRDQLQRYAQQLQILSRTDPLTGLLNVRDMKEEFGRMLASARRHGEPVTAIYIDIDDFKQINDSQGHDCGDKVLKAVGRAMQSVSRADDRCFRCGGDEFCILLDNCTQSDAETHVVPRLLALLAANNPGIHISCGLAQSGPKRWLDSRSLIRLADRRMYLAKREYKRQRAQSTASNSSSCGGPR